jgi:hypothetical protein
MTPSRFLLLLLLLTSTGIFAQCSQADFAHQKIEYKADSIACDTFGVRWVRNATTHLWGAATEYQLFIPCRYDSIRRTGLYSDYFVGWRGEEAHLWWIENNGKPVYIAQDFRIESSGSNHVLKVKKNGKWGQINYESLQVMIPFQYDTPVFRPLPEDLQYGNVMKELKILKADMIVYDTIHGEGNFFARSAATKKWGMYMSHGNHPAKMIPMAYDSIAFSPAPFYPVWNNGKVGAYCTPFYPELRKESIPCIYDDYRLADEENYVYHLVLKKDGKWGVIDWFTGKTLLDFTYDKPEDIDIKEVPDSDYYQK